MFRLINFILLILLSINVMAAQKVLTADEYEEAKSKCNSTPPYYGYRFNQVEIDALLEQWIPLHHAWRKEFEEEVEDTLLHSEQMALIHDASISKYAKDPR
ncbi:hypothetical protein, partial [Candidatus Albibeggiatoa sp. nov. NOAA]|uniref:hypothetical protein n=1 Tax=Candidatus Albibeggiatoa sp. nov. NOAA TaxID=3162724 RepID=UPI0032FF1DCB|nr:hypothetical protein [Thiotrichaceae bacterium]